METAILKAKGRWKSNAYQCYDKEPQFADFHRSTEMMWRAAMRPRVECADGSAPSQVDGLCESVLIEDIAQLADALTPPVSSPKRHRIGDQVNTQWGVATLVSAASNGGFMCSWAHLDDLFRMDFMDERAPDGERRCERYLSEVTDVV